MDNIKRLLQYVTRGFYDTKSILVMDALLKHVVLSDEELHQLLSIPAKEIRQICAKLKDDKLLKDHTQREQQENTYGYNKNYQKTYYYIHYTVTIDAIKWKVHSMNKKAEEALGKKSQPQGYVCPLCTKKFTTLEAVTNVQMDGTFTCDVCSTVIVEDTTSDESRVHQDRLEKLMQQIKPIIDELRKIDDMQVAENTFETSLAKAVPAQLEVTAGSTSSIKTAGRGTTSSQTGSNKSNTLTVNLSTGAEDEAAQRDEKAKLAEQNALPAWYMESTVGRQMVMGDTDEQHGFTEIGNDDDYPQKKDTKEGSAVKKEDVAPRVKAEETEPKLEEEEEDALAAYYKQYEAKQRAEDEEEEEEEDDDDDDDEGDFDDVELAVEEADFDEE